MASNIAMLTIATPLVEKQQEYEKIIQRAKTVEEIKTATLSFD